MCKAQGWKRSKDAWENIKSNSQSQSRLMAWEKTSFSTVYPRPHAPRYHYYRGNRTLPPPTAFFLFLFIAGRKQSLPLLALTKSG